MLSKPTFRLLLAIALILAVVGTFTIAAPANAQGQCTATHVVQPGENLFRIALAANTNWPYLMQLNNLPNANFILVGQTLCVAVANVVTPVPTVTPIPVPNPVPGVFPTIMLNTLKAGPGDTVTITGINFPPNAAVNIYVMPYLSPVPADASGTATIAANGTLNTNFTVPTTVSGVALHGPIITILVRDSATGFYGFNSFFNTKP